MKPGFSWLPVAAGCLLAVMGSCMKKGDMSATVPITLDHNRMLVDGEMQRKDGSWRKVRLWVDTGNPDFFMSESLARDLGIDLSAALIDSGRGTVPSLDVTIPGGVRIGGMVLDFDGVSSKVMFKPKWLFSTMHNDANLPSAVMKKYRVAFDYPESTFFISESGGNPPRGKRIPAGINPQTGIVQLDARIGEDKFSLALDNGASYSFISSDVLGRLIQEHPEWPRMSGALGCANIWGYWPEEESWLVVRVPELQWGGVSLVGVGLAGLPNFFTNGMSLGAWYSQKTVRPVDGFLGPNALKAFRIEIDYADSAVYFENKGKFDTLDMDIIGLTLRLNSDGRYQVIGVAWKGDGAAAEKPIAGDILLQVDDLKTTKATMGTIVDALRGKPGEKHVLLLDRDGRRISLEATVEHFL